MPGTLRAALEPVLERDAQRRARLLLQWSSRWRDVLAYVLFRSRGYIARSAYRFSADLIEAFTISWIASPELALSSLMSSLAIAASRALVDGLLSTYRTAQLAGRALPRSALLAGCLVAVVVPFVAGFVLLGKTWLAHSDQRWLLALRLAALVVEVGLAAWTAPVTAERRIFVPGWMTSLQLWAALATAPLAVAITGRAGYLLAIILFAAGRMASEIAVARRLWHQRTTTTASFAARDWLALVVTLAHHLPTVALLVLGARYGTPHVLVAAWALKLTARNLSLRPLRALSLDVRGALARREEWAAARLLERALLLGLVPIVVAIVAWFVIERTAGGAALLLGIWMATTVAAQLAWSCLLSAGLERGLRLAIILGRTLQAATIVLWTGPALPLIGLLLASELAFVGLALWRWLSVDRVRALGTHHRHALTAQPFAPRAFHAAQRAIGERGRALALRLRGRRMTLVAQLAEIERLLDGQAILLALDSGRVIAWLPDHDDVEWARERLLCALPLDLESVRPLTLPSPTMATVATGSWTYDERTGWCDLDGRPARDAELLRSLSRLRAVGERHLFDSVAPRIRRRQRPALVAVRQAGVTVAAHPADASGERTVIHKPVPIELHEDEFQAMLDKLRNSADARQEVRPPEPHEALAWCRQRRGGFRWLALAIVFALWWAPKPSLASGAFRVACDSEDGPFSVLYRDEAGTIHAIADFNFELSRYSRASFSCEKWLEQNRFAFNGVEITPIYNSDGRPLARLSGKTRGRLHRACRRSPDCKLRLPYGLSIDPRDWLDAARRKSPFGDDAALCEASPVLPTRPPVPARVDDRPLLAKLGDLHSWRTPETLFGDEVSRIITGDHLYWISTLSLSAEEVAKLERALTAYPHARAILLFDLSAALHEGALFEVLAARPQRVQLLPIFRSPHVPRYFHMKGAAGGDQLVFTSGNLKRYQHNTMVDLGFTTTAAEASRAFAGLMARSAQESCSDAPWLACTLKARFLAGDPRAEAIAAAHRETCARLSVNDEAQRLAALPAQRSPFFTAEEADARQALHDLVRGAHHRLDAVTHQLGDQQLVTLLGQAAERGVSTRLWLGSPHPVEWLVPKPWLRQIAAQAGWEAHAKLLLVDSTTLLWGSGNFTENGLARSREVFFRTRDARLLRAAADYLENLGQPLGGGRERK